MNQCGQGPFKPNQGNLRALKCLGFLGGLRLEWWLGFDFLSRAKGFNSIFPATLRFLKHREHLTGKQCEILGHLIQVHVPQLEADRHYTGSGHLT